MTQDSTGLAAKTFMLPQPQQQAPIVQDQPFDDGVQVLEGLQWVQGQTSEYYKKVAALKSFMQSVNRNLGIDVRVPDLSRPESVELNQVYQQALADILAQGNELKQSASINTMLINRGDHFTDQSYNKSAARFQYGRDYFGGVDKAILETNDFTSTPSYDEREFNQKNQAYLEQKARYEKLRDENPDKREYYDYQLRALTPPAQRVYRPASETSSDRRYGRQVRAGGNWLKKIANLLYGAHNSYSPDEKDLNANGTPYLVSTEFVGTKIGDGELQRWRFDPDDKTLEMIIKTKDGMKAVDVTNQDPQVLTAKLSGLAPEILVDAADKAGIYDDFEQAQYSKLLGEDYEKLVQTNVDKTKDSVAKNAKEVLEKDLMSIENKGWFQDDDRLQVGPFRIVKRKGNKYEIENIDEALTNTSAGAKGLALDRKEKRFWEATDEGRKKLLKFLIAQNAHLDYYKTKYPGKQPQTGTTVAPIQKATEFNPADY